MVIESYRYGETNGEVYRLIQRVECSGGGDDTSLNILFKTIPNSEVTRTVNTKRVKDNYLLLLAHRITLITDSGYKEDGNILLEERDFRQTEMTFTVEITYDATKTCNMNILRNLQSLLDVTKCASEYYDRSEDVDNLTNLHFINKIQ